MFKYVLSSIIAFSATGAMADEISSRELADLLLNETIAQCVSELKAKTTSYDLQASGTSVGRVRGSRENKRQVSNISYQLVQGGDMIMGDASIVVTYKFGSQLGFEEVSAYRIPYVDSCRVEVKAF